MLNRSFPEQHRVHERIGKSILWQPRQREEGRQEAGVRGVKRAEVERKESQESQCESRPDQNCSEGLLWIEIALGKRGGAEVDAGAYRRENRQVAEDETRQPKAPDKVSRCPALQPCDAEAESERKQIWNDPPVHRRSVPRGIATFDSAMTAARLTAGKASVVGRYCGRRHLRKGSKLPGFRCE